MKSKHILLYGIFISLLFTMPIRGFENNIGGNAKTAAMGFSQVGNISNFLWDSAGSGASRGTLAISNTDLYEAGLVYNFFQGTLNLGRSWKMNFSYEAIADQDQIDNSGYSQKIGAIGLAKRITDRLQLGINISIAQYGLYNESIGNGYAAKLGMLYGPFTVANSECSLLLQVDDLTARREYDTSRIEKQEPELTLGVNIAKNNFNYVMDLKSDDYRCGIEYRIMPSLALRAGFNNGEPTFGIGLLRTPLNIDYAYWLSEVGATHRIGSTISF